VRRQTAAEGEGWARAINIPWQNPQLAHTLSAKDPSSFLMIVHQYIAMLHHLLAFERPRGHLLGVWGYLRPAAAVAAALYL